MTATVSIRLNPASAVTQPLACEIRGSAGRRGLVVDPDERTEVQLPSGPHILVAMLPDGLELYGSIDVPDDGAVEVWIGDPQSSGSVAAWSPDGDWVQSSTAGIAPVAPSALADRTAPVTGGSTNPVWARLWSGSYISSLDGSKSSETDDSMRLHIRQGVGLYAVQLGGPGFARRVACIPPAFTSTVTLKPSTEGAGFDDGLRVEVAGSSALAASLMGYLATGQSDAAAVIAPDVLKQAFGMLESGSASPEAVLAMAFYLLRQGRDGAPDRQAELLMSRSEVLADQFEWLPDALVVDAYRLLRTGGVSDREVARSRLMQAAEAGIPRYTEGLRLLFGGLRSLAAENPEDEELAQMIGSVADVAASCDWSAIHTTYWAERPGIPTLDRIVGWPEDFKGLRILAWAGNAQGSEAEQHAAMALLDHGRLLGGVGSSWDAIGVYDLVVDRFGADPAPELRTLVAQALFNKGITLGGLGRSEDAIGVYDLVVDRFGADPAPELRTLVAQAVSRRSIPLAKPTLPELGRSEGAIGANDQQARVDDQTTEDWL